MSVRLEPVNKKRLAYYRMPADLLYILWYFLTMDHIHMEKWKVGELKMDLGNDGQGEVGKVIKEPVN